MTALGFDLLLEFIKMTNHSFLYEQIITVSGCLGFDELWFVKNSGQMPYKIQNLVMLNMFRKVPCCFLGIETWPLLFIMHLKTEYENVYIQTLTTFITALFVVSWFPPYVTDAFDPPFCFNPVKWGFWNSSSTSQVLYLSLNSLFNNLTSQRMMLCTYMKLVLH